MSRTTKNSLKNTFEFALILILIFGGVILPPRAAHAASYSFSVLVVGGGAGGGAGESGFIECTARSERVNSMQAVSCNSAANSH